MKPPRGSRVPACRAVLLLTFVMLAGCQIHREPRPLSSEAPPPPTFVDAPSRCTAARARFGLGRRITAPLLEEMRMRSGARRAHAVLVTEPETPFDANRLIVDIESNGRIVGVRCA